MLPQLYEMLPVKSGMKRAAVFSCLGLGDGVISLVLCNNLRINGFETTLFHPTLSTLQRWVPHTKICPFPPLEKLEHFDALFIFFEKTERMEAVIAESTRKWASKTKILNPIATPNQDYPYWEVGKFDGRVTFAENIERFCACELKLEKATKEAGLLFPKGVKRQRYARRVAIHPTSSRVGRNWPPQRYFKLAKKLEGLGYEVAFTMGAHERDEWMQYNPPLFSTLDEMATFVGESGAFIGNDSGIGHLASALHIPTLTLCRARQVGQFWRPAWGKTKVLYPPLWCPNLKGLRLRDKFWKYLIPVRRVLRAFVELTNRSDSAS